MSSLALYTENLVYTYPNGVQALRGVSVEIPDKTCTFILGRNGSGKTTFLLCITGLLRGSGIVRVYGRDPWREFNETRKLIGLVLQDPDDQLFNLTVYDEIAYTLRSMHVPEEEVRRRVTLISKQLCIEDLLDRPIVNLSFGEKKKVAIASVLVYKPRIIILDEPTLGIDPASREELYRLLRNLKREYTVIVTTHDIELAAELADLVYIFDKGQAVAAGPPEEILTDIKLLERCSLRPPIITQLFLKANIDIERPPIRLEEAASMLSRMLGGAQSYLFKNARSLT